MQTNEASGFKLEELDTSVPVLLLGGKHGTLSLARSFGRVGITVRVSATVDCWGLYSRYCVEAFKLPNGKEADNYWSDLLLSPGCDHLHGHLIIACNDAALQFVANYCEALSANYRLMNMSAELQLALLDKKETLKIAEAADVPAPRFWDVNTEDDLQNLRDTVEFPVMVKPILSHEFMRVFGRKLYIIEDDVDELCRLVKLAWEKELEVMVVEMIPGPDSNLSSYYTYIDEEGRSLFDYTKCVLRRFPVNRGHGTYHKSKWFPETAEMGKKFFKGAGLKGFGNIEFKKDHRDGKLKVIECNSRFTLAQELVHRSGAPLDLIVYCSVTGQPAPSYESYDNDVALATLPQDFLAFRELNRRGELSFFDWVSGLISDRPASTLNDWGDPVPSIFAMYDRVRSLLRKV